MPISLGNEVLLAERFGLVRGRRVGLITNPSGVNARLEATADALLQSGVNLTALFGPEHGVQSDRPAGAPVASSRDGRADIPVHSLYGETRRPTPEMLSGIDVMLFDVQDVGARFYTYAATMVHALEACAEQGVPFVVLDRPNPIGGAMEGNLLDPAFASFVGPGPILLRHGMTAGELARLFNAERNIGADLTVVPVSGWRRAMFYDETGLLWVPPSPNMPALETAVVYPGTCLVEGTALSEGRGTPKPFEQVGAPGIDGRRLARRLNERGIPGAIFRPVAFEPFTGKQSGQACEGVQVHVTDRRAYPAVRAGLEALTAVRDLFPGLLAWREVDGIYPFDRLMGTDRVRHALDAGAGAEEIVASFEPDIRAFAERRRAYLLYE
jgi:uncharacterized protein YbbC (DUF1343 family)